MGISNEGTGRRYFRFVISVEPRSVRTELVRFSPILIIVPRNDQLVSSGNGWPLAIQFGEVGSR